MKYKLIAIDMDGTLLNSNDEISERNKMILSKAIGQDIFIILATGRIFRSALHYSEYIGIRNPIIACNGAMIVSNDGDKIIYENAIKTELSKEIIRLAEENNIYYHFYDRDTFYYKKNYDVYMQYYKYYEDNFRRQNVNLKSFDNPLNILNRINPKIYKFVLIEDDTNKLSAFRKKLENVTGISVSSSWNNNIEVMNEGVSKGSGLEYLTEALNIDSSQVVAIGDNENDMSMFKVAGLAVAMANGDKTIREYADVITTNNDEDGVANAIERYVLND
ncbi:Cof-type HAD-IIB family hydrolase [Schnuerera sp. xch1]|uniref:Cof-type HAD-IIB family hydrolase n=1 Tax=Schnuerera sp. xch1 TaxID=2874283 RepID=UPI001CBB66A4|nr:Cof-type HAD-IIB family hydrolase [Schnuerera sp. xch1]MBZ2174199.1 Cof-type HAD-IIB family hydrolase [Schnuerera sp. xch1]